MKKLLGLFLVLVLAFVLSGCNGENKIELSNGCTAYSKYTDINVTRYVCDGVELTPSEYNEKYNSYFTKEEVDEMFREFEASLEEEYFDEIGDEFDKINDLIKICNKADTPDDIGGLGDTDCDEMIKWYSDNWEELYDLLEYIDELEDRIEELESKQIVEVSGDVTVELRDVIVMGNNIEHSKFLYVKQEPFTIFLQIDKELIEGVIYAEDSWKVTQFEICGDECEILTDELNIGTIEYYTYSELITELLDLMKNLQELKNIK